MKKSMYLGSISFIAILYSAILACSINIEDDLMYKWIMIANVILFAISVVVALTIQKNILLHICMCISFILQVSFFIINIINLLFLVSLILIVIYWVGYAFIKNDRFSSHFLRAIFLFVFGVFELFNYVLMSSWWYVIVFVFMTAVVFLYFSGKDKFFIYDLIFGIAFLIFLISDVLYYSPQPFLLTIKITIGALYFIVCYSKKIKNNYISYQEKFENKITKQEQLAIKLEVLASLKEKQIITASQFEERKKSLLEEITNV